jgi:DNA-binding transcriptional LysR family regulator
MRKGHAAAQRPLTLKTFLSLRQMKIAQSIFDEELARQQLNREIMLNLPHWLIAPLVVESTDFVTVVSRRMANLFNTRHQLLLRPLPFGNQTFQWRMYWHRRHDEHPAHKWMRQLVIRACNALSPRS